MKMFSTNCDKCGSREVELGVSTNTHYDFVEMTITFECQSCNTSEEFQLDNLEEISVNLNEV